METWVEKSRVKFSITMGDGAVYFPLSMNANKSVEFNIAEFDFRNLDGTLVTKRRRRGTTYDLTLIFQGGDHLDVAMAFQKSSYNTKPWSIEHPYYGNLGVQPITPVSYDNGNQVQGVTIIKVTVRETLNYKQVIAGTNPFDSVTSAQQSTATHYAAYFVNAVPKPTVKDVASMKSDVSKAQQAYASISAGANDITNAYNKANAAINAAVNDMQGAISAMQYFLALPAIINDTVANRVSYLVTALTAMSIEVSSLSLPNLKAIWFSDSGVVMSAICLAAITNITPADYQYSTQVGSVIATITEAYNNYLQSLDTIQTATGAGMNSWIADPDSLISLDNLISLTISALYAIQVNSKQPRYLTLTRDSNVVTIAWKIYGLIADDSTIDRIISDNNIGLNTLLQVPKGRQILYYV